MCIEETICISTVNFLKKALFKMGGVENFLSYGNKQNLIFYLYLIAEHRTQTFLYVRQVQYC